MPLKTLYLIDVRQYELEDAHYRISSIRRSRRYSVGQYLSGLQVQQLMDTGWAVHFISQGPLSTSKPTRP